MSSIAAEYLWVLLLGHFLVISYCLIRAGTNAYRAVQLWRLRDVEITDPIIAKSLEEAVPPPYTLYALGWSLLAGGSLAVAYFAVAIG